MQKQMTSIDFTSLDALTQSLVKMSEETLKEVEKLTEVVAELKVDVDHLVENCK